MRLFNALLAAVLLTACGGGDGSGSSSSNAPPTITSATTATFAENGTGTVYQAAATDPKGRAVTFRLEGSDAARFAITSAGAVTFVTPPDFEAPTDGNRDNVYELTLVVGNGVAEARADLRVTVSNQPDAAVLRKVADYNYPRAVTPVPGGGAKIFVAQVDGQIYQTDPATAGRGQVYLTMSDLYPIKFIVGLNERPLLNMIPGPDYATSGNIYAMVVSAAGNLEVRRYGRLASGLGDPASADVILRISGVLQPDDSSTDSLGGGMAFGPDGYLYLGIGVVRRPGSVADGRAQDLTLLNGKILRIDVRNDAFPADPNRDYAIPADNPFRTGARAPEIYAYGLENPRRMYFDGSTLLIGEAHSGEQFISDNQLQEVDLLRPQDAGANFGYPAVSGAGITPPVITTNGALNHFGAMTGGFVYRGPVTPFVGQYVLADALTGRFWTIAASSLVQGTTQAEANLTLRNKEDFLPGYSPRTISFGTDASNNLYVLSDGEVDVLELR